MGLNIKDLQYFSDLFELSEAMQYAFNNEPKTDNERENQRFWIGQVFQKTKSLKIQFVQ